VPSRLLFATKPLLQLLNFVLVLFLVLDLDHKTVLSPPWNSNQAEASEEKDLNVDSDNVFVAEVFGVLGSAAQEVGHLELGPGGGQRHLLVDPA